MNGPSDAGSISDTPRIRPGILSPALVGGGLCLLHLAAGRAYFVSVLRAENIPELKYHLCWLMLGGALAIAAGSLYYFLTRKAATWKTALGLAFITVFMLGMSQGASLSARDSLSVVVEAIRWDKDSQEFVLTVYSAPWIAAACRDGDLDTIVRIRGKRMYVLSGRSVSSNDYDSSTGRVTQAPDKVARRSASRRIFTEEELNRILTSRVVDGKLAQVELSYFEVGPGGPWTTPTLTTSRRGLSRPVESYTVRVPWDPGESDMALNFQVMVAIASRQGVPIGPTAVSSLREVQLPIRQDDE